MLQGDQVVEFQSILGVISLELQHFLLVRKGAEQL